MIYSRKPTSWPMAFLGLAAFIAGCVWGLITP